MPIAINAWMSEVISQLENVLKPGQHINYTHSGSDTVVLDPSLLRHIVQNLVSNASKFSPEDAIIEMRTTLNMQQCTLSISDKGIGISDEDQTHLFERFFRGYNAVNIQGTGLGLHIVSKYAELMNGKVSVVSALEQGTTFTVTFNIATA